MSRAIRHLKKAQQRTAKRWLAHPEVNFAFETLLAIAKARREKNEKGLTQALEAVDEYFKTFINESHCKTP